MASSKSHSLPRRGSRGFEEALTGQRNRPCVDAKGRGDRRALLCLLRESSSAPCHAGDDGGPYLRLRARRALSLDRGKIAMHDLDVATLSRLQFALTALYHFLFVPLTLGLSWLLAIMESVYVMTGRTVWRDATKFWGTLFGINFAMGVATGVTMEFQFGTNWSYPIMSATSSGRRSQSRQSSRSFSRR